jgi:peptide subunit release factor 1 (eRF1)
MCVSSSRNERMISEVVIPPLPITRKFYKCDKVFHLDHLLTLYDDHTSGGLVLIRGELVEMYNFQGSRRELIDKITIRRQKAQKAGGSSSGRFNRTQQAQVHDYIGDIATRIKENYFDYTDGKSRVKVLVIGGNCDLHSRVIHCKEFEPKLSKITKLVNVNDTDSVESLTRYLSETATEIDTNDDVEKMIQLQALIETNPTQIVYGKAEIIDAIESKLLKQLYIHNDAKIQLDDEQIQSAQENGAEIIYIRAQTAKTRYILDYG